MGLQIGPFPTRVQLKVDGLAEPLYEFYHSHELISPTSLFSFHIGLRQQRAFPRLYRRTVRFTVDGRRPHEDLPLAHALPVFEWGLNLIVALRSHCFLMLHSAALERNGKALLLPAMPGYGKSTLCAGLAHRGWRILSDEFGFLRPETREIIPAPRPIALKNESIDIIRAFAPEARIGPSTHGTRKGTVAHVIPDVESVLRQRETSPAGLIVFPRWSRGARTEMKRLPRSESFMLLATNAFNYELLGESGFTTLLELVSHAECYRLVYSDLEDAVTELNRLAGDHD